jgi:hypothetical protein
MTHNETKFGILENDGLWDFFSRCRVINYILSFRTTSFNESILEGKEYYEMIKVLEFIGSNKMSFTNILFVCPHIIKQQKDAFLSYLFLLVKFLTFRLVVLFV